MSVFQVELKKVVDDSYPIETGFGLEEQLITDLKGGLVGNIKKFTALPGAEKDSYAVRITSVIREEE